ncbi:hypothetical protein M422DRAFT_252016 [Sphaerobolus stellatus SS14]|uniref:Uncharacterized protein n=1 Tax=Sphaerobolus stellatus (strain SS14) TaxID=990650 RepID=A0A0C9W0L9_SPHS4|nr:hypothetical protein M422DRAFT_252016 [Sphaerobolus stellatus SS14]
MAPEVGKWEPKGPQAVWYKEGEREAINKIKYVIVFGDIDLTSPVLAKATKFPRDILWYHETTLTTTLDKNKQREGPPPLIHSFSKLDPDDKSFYVIGHTFPIIQELPQKTIESVGGKAAIGSGIRDSPPKAHRRPAPVPLPAGYITFIIPLKLPHRQCVEVIGSMHIWKISGKTVDEIKQRSSRAFNFMIHKLQVLPTANDQKAVLLKVPSTNRGVSASGHNAGRSVAKENNDANNVPQDDPVYQHAHTPPIQEPAPQGLGENLDVPDDPEPYGHDIIGDEEDEVGDADYEFISPTTASAPMTPERPATLTPSKTLITPGLSSSVSAMEWDFNPADVPIPEDRDSTVSDDDQSTKSSPSKCKQAKQGSSARDKIVRLIRSRPHSVD